MEPGFYPVKQDLFIFPLEQIAQKLFHQGFTAQPYANAKCKAQTGQHNHYYIIDQLRGKTQVFHRNQRAEKHNKNIYRAGN